MWSLEIVRDVPAFMILKDGIFSFRKPFRSEFLVTDVLLFFLHFQNPAAVLSWTGSVVLFA